MINRQYYLGGDISDHYDNGQVDLPRMRKGGVNAIFFSILSSDEYSPNRHKLKLTMDLMDLALRQIQRDHDQMELALNASDIERIYRAAESRRFCTWRVRPTWMATSAFCATSTAGIAIGNLCCPQSHE